MTDRIEFRRTSTGWRWRRQAPNGEIVAASTEGYVNYADAVENAARVNGSELVAEATIEDED